MNVIEPATHCGVVERGFVHDNAWSYQRTLSEPFVYQSLVGKREHNVIPFIILSCESCYYMLMLEKELTSPLLRKKLKTHKHVSLLSSADCS